MPGSFGCGRSVLATIATFAPSRAARNAIAFPMPRDAPVMNSVLPVRLIAPPIGLLFQPYFEKSGFRFCYHWSQRSGRNDLALRIDPDALYFGGSGMPKAA